MAVSMACHATTTRDSVTAILASLEEHVMSAYQDTILSAPVAALNAIAVQALSVQSATHQLASAPVCQMLLIYSAASVLQTTLVL